MLLESTPAAVLPPTTSGHLLRHMQQIITPQSPIIWSWRIWKLSQSCIKKLIMQSNCLNFMKGLEGPVLTGNLVAEKLAENDEELKAKKEAKKEKLLISEKGHVKPDTYLDAHEKLLISIATKGVVKLFNAVDSYMFSISWSKILLSLRSLLSQEFQ